MTLEDYIQDRLPSERFVPGKSKVPLQTVMFSKEELLESIETLLSGNLVMGEKVSQFEARWRQWLGCRHAVATTSGTMALFLAMMWLKFHHATTGRDEILIPAVSWSTTLTTALIVGLRPVLVDVDLETLCVNSFADGLSDRTLAVVPVHLLGHSCNMAQIMREARGASVRVIEDACEAHGARWDDQKVGTFGDVGCFSFMFSHHISTIEGGMICVNSDELEDVFRTFRAHGWSRELPSEKRKALEDQYANIDERFLFHDLGLNVRPTEIIGAFGIHQLKKLDGFIERRRLAFAQITEALKPYEGFLHLFPESPGEFHSPFAYPIVIREGTPFSRKALVRFLEDRLIETRPIVAGNLARQPVFERYSELIEVRGSLANAERIHHNGFFFGINQGTDEAKVDYITGVFKEFFASVGRRAGAMSHA